MFVTRRIAAACRKILSDDTYLITTLNAALEPRRASVIIVWQVNEPPNKEQEP